MIGFKKFGNAPNIAISASSSGTFSTSVAADVTNLSCASFITHGLPIWLMLVDEGTASESFVRVGSNTGNNSAYANFGFYQDSTQLNNMDLGVVSTAANNPEISVPPSAFQYFYQPAAGTYTFKFRVVSFPSSGDSAYVYRCKLVVYEMGY